MYCYICNQLVDEYHTHQIPIPPYEQMEFVIPSSDDGGFQRLSPRRMDYNVPVYDFGVDGITPQQPDIEYDLELDQPISSFINKMKSPRRIVEQKSLDDDIEYDDELDQPISSFIPQRLERIDFGGPKRHLIHSESTNASYECDICRMVFRDEKRFRSHYNAHFGIYKKKRDFICDICRKRFSDTTSLNIHYRTHTGEKPYICKECGKGFSTKIGSIVHYRTHTGEKPYICKECGKGFVQLQHLIDHNKAHTGEKPYICSICGKGFTRNHSLNYHLNHIHFK